jgi:hypothetical protein
MTGHARTTTFVTGAAGFIDTELIEVLTSRGHRVCGRYLTPEQGSQQTLETLDE